MNKKIIPILAIVIIAIGGVGVYADIIDPIGDNNSTTLNQTNDTDSSNPTGENDTSSNSSDVQSGTNTSNVSNSDNMDEIANDPNKAVAYLNSKGKDQETVETSTGKVTLINHVKPKSNAGTNAPLER